jgi:hypothetical protein
MENTKVIDLHGKTVFRQVIDELCRNDDKGIVTDCVILARTKTKDGVEGNLVRYWFGEESTVACLGMTCHMQFILSNYIEGIDFCG